MVSAFLRNLVVVAVFISLGWMLCKVLHFSSTSSHTSYKEIACLIIGGWTSQIFLLVLANSSSIFYTLASKEAIYSSTFFSFPFVPLDPAISEELLDLLVKWIHWLVFQGKTN